MPGRIREILAAALMLVCALAMSDASAQVKSRFDLPAQALADSLRAVGSQTDTNVLFDPPLVARLRAPALKGELTIDQALGQLFAGTGIKHEFLNEKTIVLAAQNLRSELDGAEDAPAGGVIAADAGERSKDLRDRLRVAQSAGTRTAGSESSARDESATASDVSKVQEIIVTATKRAQSIQDVPLSITAITADEIDRRGLVNAEDYLRGIPGVNQVEGYQGQSIVIRGMETSLSTQNFQAGTTVATYFGETPTTNSAGLAGASNLDLKLVDIERVEVLRGPRGTAFGSSSMGGAVRTIPVAPKLDRFEGRVGGDYSATSGAGGDNYSAQGVVNVPLIKDKLAIRAVAYQYQDSGFYRNRAHSAPAFQANVVAPFGAQAFATDAEEVGEYHVLGGRIAALFQATDNLRLTLNYLSQKTETDGIGVATIGTYDQAILQVAPEHAAGGRTAGFHDTDIDLLNAVVEYDVGWGNVLATYSHVESEWTQSSAFGYLGLDLPWSYHGPSPHRENVGEIRLATRLDGPWDFLAGLYAEDLDDEIHYDYRSYPPSTSLGTYADGRKLRQKAAFGEVSRKLGPKFTLTGGFRAYEYDRTIRVDADGIFYGPGGIHRTDQSDASGTSLRGNLSYKATDDTLLYADFSQGFRLGRPQQGLPAGVCDLDGDGVIDGTNTALISTQVVNSDTVDSYELGGKFALFDRNLALTIDVFRMEWSDVPVEVFSGSGQAQCSLLTYVTNAGEALSEGIELQASWQIGRPLRVDFGASSIHARLTEGVLAQNIPRGNRLAGSPKYNANLGLQYEFAIAGHPAYVRADSIYVGSFYGDLLESPNNKGGDYIKIDASARISFGDFSAGLFVENLTGEDSFTYRSTSVQTFYGYRLRPRTVGLRLSYTF